MRSRHTLEVGNFGVEVWVNIIIFRFNEASSSKRDYARVAGSAGRIPLSSWYAVYELQSTEFPPLQGFLQTLAAGPPLCSTLHSIPLSTCVCVFVCGASSWTRFQVIRTVFHPGGSNCDLPGNFCTVITPVKMRI